MNAIPKTKNRAEEFNWLIVAQGHVTRSMQFGDYRPTDVEQREIHERATRMIELAEMLGFKDAEREVNDRIASWLRANPLALGKRRVKRIIEDPASGDLDNGVTIQIGDAAAGGYFYQVLAADCANRNGILHFTVPDSIAEHFRQQGRREVQAEMRAVLNAARA
jgi:hypothetical protein